MQLAKGLPFQYDSGRRRRHTNTADGGKDTMARTGATADGRENEARSWAAYNAPAPDATCGRGPRVRVRNHGGPALGGCERFGSSG